MTERKLPSSVYREKAKAAREQARRVLNRHFKRKCLEMAEAFDKLAEIAEKSERGASD
jgi:hypothetical protein